MKIRLITMLASLASLPLLLWRGSIALGETSAAPSLERSESSLVVRVGLSQNEPQIFINRQGNPAGFWVKLLDAIAQRERWKLVYIPCEWQSCLRSLQTGTLDLMPGVAYTPEKDWELDFNQEPVLASWSEIYVNPYLKINSIQDLNQKRVAVLDSSLQESDLKSQAQALGLRLTFIETDSFQNIFEQVSSGAVDAGLVNIYYARWNMSQYNVLHTHLIFNPTRLHFAVPQGDPQSLIPAIDRHLWLFIQNRHSPYYQAIDRWLSGPSSLASSLRYLWLPFSVSAATISLLGLAIWNWSLKKEICRRQTVENKLSASEQRYSSLIAALPVGIFRNNLQGENVYINDRGCEMLGMTPKEASGSGWVAAMHPEDRDYVWAEWTRSYQENRPFKQQYRFLKSNGEVIWVYGQAVPERDSTGKVCGYVGSVTDITDRKRAEDSLRAQEERLRLALQAAGMICWEYESTTRKVHYWGRYTAEGWQSESWQNSLEEFYQEIHPNDRAQVQFAYALALNNKTNLNIEYRLLLPGQDPIWVLSLGQVQKNNQGTLIIGVSLDITKQKTIEAKLRASEQRFRRAVENAPFPMMIHAEDGEVLQINGTWTSMTGYTPADIPTTSHWAKLAYGNGAQAALENTAESYRLETRIDKGDWTIRTRDGEARIWHFHVAPLGLLPDGRRFVISMAIDITQRRAAEQNLQEREAFLRDMTNHIPGVVIQYVLHPDGSDRVDYIGPGCFDLWEWQQSDLEQDSSLLWKVIHPEDAPALYASVVESAEHLTPWLWEWRITTVVTHTQKWVQGRGNPQRLENGDVRWTSVIFDISDRKQTEQALLEAKEEAEQASYYKTSFLATMSHEIRTPMNGVLGMLNLLGNTALTDLQRSHLQMAQFSADSLLGLINDILDFSKIEAGKMELEQIEFDLLHELETIAQSMAAMAHDKGLEFIVDVQTFPTFKALGDPRRIRQIVTNLVSNAIKFTAKGFILLSSHLRPSPEASENDRWQLTIAVEDTGVGIPAEKLDTLFDAFTQVDVSTTRKYGGSGLGLAIVKQLSTLMGGSINVRSEIDRGSCFEFTVPLSFSHSPVLSVPSDQTFQSLSIAICSDQERLLQVLATQLKGWGATVICLQNLSSPSEIDRAIEEKLDRVDLIIMDQSFVERGVQTLHSNPQEHQIPVVIMTTVSDRLNGGVPDHYGYLLKPVTPTQLIQLLSQICQTCPLPPLALGNDQKLPLDSSRQCWSPSTRVLVVEDSTINQAVIQGFLDILGLQVDCVDSGQAALQQLQHIHDPYPLIFMDCQMPEMDGYETTRQIRQGKAGEKYQQVPIIALTAHAMPDDRDKCLAAGMNDYLTKPLTLRDLRNILQHWLGDLPDPPETMVQSAEPTKPPTPEPLSIPLFDAQGLLERTEGYRDLAEMMCGRFLEGIPQTLEELRAIVYPEDSKAIEALNLEDVERYAHRLKGSASLIGAEAFRHQAAQLEDRAKQKDIHSDAPDSANLSDILEMTETLCVLFEQTQVAIEHWLLKPQV